MSIGRALLIVMVLTTLTPFPALNQLYAQHAAEDIHGIGATTVDRTGDEPVMAPLWLKVVFILIATFLALYAIPWLLAKIKQLLRRRRHPHTQSEARPSTTPIQTLFTGDTF